MNKMKNMFSENEYNELVNDMASRTTAEGFKNGEKWFENHDPEEEGYEYFMDIRNRYIEMNK